MSTPTNNIIDPRSGFNPTTSTFHSKRPSIPHPTTPTLSITTFLSSISPTSTSTLALVDASTGSHLTYFSLWNSISTLASHLHFHHNISHSDVVLLLSPNSLLFPVATLAVASLGAVLTTTNPLLTPRELQSQIEPCNPKLILTTSSLLPKVQQSFPSLPFLLLEDLNLEEKKNDNQSSLPVVRQSDPATILYSSGTTGVSKGVVCTHRNLIAMAQIVMNRFKFDSASSHETFICTVPMFHIYGLAVFAMGLLGVGATVVIVPKFEIGDVLSAIQKHRVTYFPLVPPILVAMAQNATGIKRRYDLGSLRKVLSGGAPLSREVMEGFNREFPGLEIVQGYGLTESSGVGASTDSAEESRRYGTAGLLSPNAEAKIVDPDTGKALPVMATGELWLRGPFVMKEYFMNPEATKSTLTSDGWLRTGDLCYIDKDGFLFVVDRLKELIKYKGYQVPPAELEALLLTHPAISDAAVIGFPDVEVGQYPMAYVVRKTGSNLSAAEVMNFVSKQVAPYKKIRRVAFIQTIPKNPSGKILRKDLVKLATSNSKI